jgi:predicted PurR-regulated permease PerM
MAGSTPSRTQPEAQQARGAAGRLIAAGVVLACLYVGSGLVMTLAVTLLLAFLCDPAVSWLSRHHIPRSVGAALAVLLLFAGAYLLVFLFYSQAQNFIEDLPRYSQNVRGHWMQLLEKGQQIEKQVRTTFAPPAPEPPPAAKKASKRQPAPPQPQPQPAQPGSGGFDWPRWLGAGLVSATGIIFMVSFIPFLIFFLLSWKDHIRRTSVSIFGAPNRVAAERTLDGITLVIRAFVFGNVLIGIVLSLASGLFFWLMKLPYPAIMGPVSGFLSLVPYLGPLLAAVLPVLTALGEFNTLSPAIVVLGGVIGLHILALNLLYPKLIGSRVHLNPVVVTLALMFWGWLWGAMGLVLAIPITASVKAVCDNVPSLKPYGRLMAD